ncbi:hypothetical protein KAU11_02980 [Candidatus Babeliales bacterium]|nr:hypothetical protein [Candidatus Babeliales bacterium]
MNKEKVSIKEKILNVPFENRNKQKFFIGAYTISIDKKDYEYLLIYTKPVDQWLQPLPLRLHSACMTSEICGGSRRCDCKWQLDFALSYIQNVNNGLVIYAPSEVGRGQGITKKLKSFNIMDTEHIRSKEAFEKLGIDPDPRTYVAQAKILSDLKISKAILITNNPEKVEAVRRAGIDIEQRLPVVQDDDPQIRAYLEMKARDFGHKLTAD